jgi:energy-coupling factor transport system permease protein
MKYRPGQSVVHRLHPVVKSIWLIWVTVAVFAFSGSVHEDPTAAAGWSTLNMTVLPLMAAGAAVCLLWVSGVAPWRIPGVRLWVTLGVVILLLHVATNRAGDPVAGPITTVGLASGLRAVGRLLAVILMSALFVLTTEPVSLAYALMRVGLPDRWGFALVTALRLAPIFRAEADHVYRAQLVRGVAYDAGAPRRWYLMLRHLSLPLIVSALRTAHALALSMEGRGFGLHRRRTYTRDVALHGCDIIAMALLVVSIPAAAWFRWGAG